ncbi:unnamed protein product [Ceratitis capitata]|uniref:(Mediterranean fruit fly) hypothetical protein n=1 Tax=Ceratitis capitata TaxID=7213 RepID=A0A811URT5_CERCA|nr:unnamed protein product [Ceratitis capitata]
MSISRCCHNASGSWGGGGFTVAAATQVFLVLTLFVVGNLSAWQENVRPKLYVELETGIACLKPSNSGFVPLNLKTN